MKEGHIESFDKTKLYYKLIEGDTEKRTLVFLHGLSGNHSVWTHAIDYFVEKKYSVLALDLCGHGKSEKSLKKERYTMKGFCDDIHAILEHLRLSNVVFIGHSLGGMLAFEYDKHYPQKASALISLAGTHKNFLYYQMIPLQWAQPVFTVFTKSIAFVADNIKRKKYPFIDYSTLPSYNPVYLTYKDLVGTPMNAYMWTVYEMTQFDTTEHLKTIKKPVLLLHGDGDRIVSRRSIRDMKELMPHAKAKILKNTTHMSTFARNAEANREIEAFLENA